MASKANICELHDLEAQFDRDRYLLFLHGSYGDVYPNLALMASFIEEFQSKVVVIVDEKYKDLAHRFRLSDLEICCIKNATRLHQIVKESRQTQALLKGKIYNTLPTIFPYLGEMSLAFILTDPDIKRLVLGLSKESRFDFSKLSETRIESLKEIFYFNQLPPGKTAVIMPFTNSNSPLSYEDLIQVIYFMDGALGYKIAINVAGVPETTLHQLEGLPIKKIEVPADAPCELAEMAGITIAVMSGVVFPFAFQQHTAKVILLMNNKNVNNNTPNETHHFRPVREWAGRDLIHGNKLLDVYFEPGAISQQFSLIKDFIKR